MIEPEPEPDGVQATVVLLKRWVYYEYAHADLRRDVKFDLDGYLKNKLVATLRAKGLIVSEPTAAVEWRTGSPWLIESPMPHCDLARVTVMAGEFAA